jgi:hypothetical protein
LLFDPEFKNRSGGQRPLCRQTAQGLCSCLNVLTYLSAKQPQQPVKCCGIQVLGLWHRDCPTLVDFEGTAMTRRDMFSWLLGKKERVAKSEQAARPEVTAPPVMDAAPPPVADSIPDTALTAAAGEAPAQPATAAKVPVTRKLLCLQKSVAPPPKSGMTVTVRNGRKTQPAKIDLVCATGRRLLVITEGSEFRRAYTRRGDGRYHLEGSPDGAGPALDFATSVAGKTIAHNANQRLRPLRYENLRRSPGFNVVHDGRRPLSDRDKAEARGQGSATGRRPVMKGPIKTPRRSKARSRMPSASR